MRRYVGASLLIGSLVSLLVLVLYEVEVFPWLAVGMGRAYAAALRAPVEFPGAYWRLGQYGLVVVAALGVAWTSVDIERWSRRALIAGMALLAIALLSVALAFRGVLFEPVSGGMAVLGSFAAGGLFAASEMGKGQRALRHLMAQRLTERDLSVLMASPARLPLAGENREATVLVCRILNDGEWRASLGPGEVTRAVNLFLRAVSGFLLPRGGFIEHAGPDRVRVLFGAPLPDPEHARHACEAALALSGRLADLNRECENRWRQRFVFGIGVVGGTLTLARFREGRGSFYGALGWEMDFARHLGGANARFGTGILVGAGTHAAVTEEFATRTMGPIDDPDSETGHEAFELLGPARDESGEASAAREAFALGMAHLRDGRPAEALDAFAAARPADDGDAPLAHWTERARRLAAGQPDQD